MKKIFLLVAVFISLKGFCQYPVNQTLGSDSTLVTSKGALKSRLINTVFTDTSSANTQRVKYYDGAQIQTKTGGAKFWLRDSTNNKWVQIGASTGAATWGSITGTLSSQTDLQTTLNLKADSVTTNSDSTKLFYWIN